MVFETVIADLLNKYVGTYFENLNASDLKIRIWNGYVELKNLMVKQSVFDDFCLPLKVKFGHIDKLIIKIPWSNLYNDPILISLDTVYLLVVPAKENVNDETKRAKAEHANKMSTVNRIESAKSIDESKSMSKIKFVDKLFEHIIKNVELHVSTLHVRFEDDGLFSDHPISIGCMFYDYSIETTDWEMVGNPDDLLYKLLKIESFVLYCNSREDLFMNKNPKDYHKMFKNYESLSINSIKNYNNVIGPIDVFSKLKINPRPVMDPTKMKTMIFINIEIDRFECSITKTQYRDVFVLIDSFGRFYKGVPYYKYRPLIEKYKGHYKEWWEFAITSVLEEHIRKSRKTWKWSFIQNHILIVKIYRETYKKKIQYPKLSRKLKPILEEYEQQLDVFNIIMARQMVEQQIEKEDLVKNKQSRSSFSWFGWSSKYEEEIHFDEQLNKEMSISERERLYKTIGYEDNSDLTVYPETYVNTIIVIKIHIIRLNVYNDQQIGQNKIVMAISKLCFLQYESLPVANSFKVRGVLGTFDVFGYKQKKILPHIVRSVQGGKYLVEIKYESKPIGRQFDAWLQILVGHLQIVYDSQTFLKLINVFQDDTNFSNTFSTINRVQLSLEDFKKRTAFCLNCDLAVHNNLGIEVGIMSSFLLIPCNGFYTSNVSILAISFENIDLKSKHIEDTNLSIDVLEKQGYSEKEMLEIMISRSYDNYEIYLNKIQALVVHKSEQWNFLDYKDMHFLKPINVIVFLDKFFIESDDRLPKLKIHTELQEVLISFKDKRLLDAIHILSSIIAPYFQYNTNTSLLNEFPNVAEKRLFINKKPKTEYTLYQETLVDIEIMLKKLSFKVLVSDINSSVYPLIEFKINKLNATFTIQKFTITIHMKLKNIFITSTNDGQIIPFLVVKHEHNIESESKVEKITELKFTMTDKNIPHNIRKLAEKKDNFHLHVNNLVITIHQIVISRYICWLRCFISKLDILKLTEDTEEIQNACPTNANTDEMETKEKVNINANILTIQVENVKVRFINPNDSIAALRIVNLITEVITTEKNTKTTISMDEVTLLNYLDDYYLYPKLLYVTDDYDAKIKFEIIHFNKTPADDLIVPNAEISCDLANIRFIYINSCILPLLEMVFNLKNDLDMLLAYNSSDSIEKPETIFIQSLYINIEATEIVFPVKIDDLNGIMMNINSLSVNNTFHVVENEVNLSAIIEEITVNCIGVDVVRVKFDELKHVKVISTVMRPITFKLCIKQNVSVSWYLNFPRIDVMALFDSIEVTMAEMDYIVILNLLKEFIKTTKHVNQSTLLCPCNSVNCLSSSKNYASNTIGTSQMFIDTNVSHKFIIYIEHILIYTVRNNLGIIVSIEKTVVILVFYFFGYLSINVGLLFVVYKDSPQIPHIICEFIIKSIYTRCLTYYNGSFYLNFLLNNLIVDKTKDTSTMNIYFSKNVDTIENIQNNILNIAYEVHNKTSEINIQVASSFLAVNFIYIYHAAIFINELYVIIFQMYEIIYGQSTPHEDLTASILEKQEESISLNTILINFIVKSPNIYFTENMKENNTNAILLEIDVVFKLSMVGESYKCISGVLKNIEMSTCYFNLSLLKHENTQLFLRPTSFYFSGLQLAEDGYKLDITLSEILISFNPDNTSFFIRAMDLITNQDDMDNNTSTLSLWIPLKIEEAEFWFLNRENSIIENLKQIDNVKDEIYSFMIPSIIISVDQNVGVVKVPVIMIVSSFQGSAKFRQSDMCVKGKFTFVLSYYNKNVATWEPFVEPKKIMSLPRPTFEPLVIDLKIEYYDKTKGENADDLIGNSTKTTQIFLKSYEILEVTLTKTSIEDLSNLIDQYTSANRNKKHIDMKTGKIVPFVIKNKLGLDFTVIFEGTQLSMYGSELNAKIEKIVLKSGEHLKLTRNLSVDIMFLIGRKHLFGDCNLIIQFDKTRPDVHFVLNMNTASKRFFENMHLYNDIPFPWALISDTIVVGGSMEVTLRSIVQVHNHLWCNVYVYIICYNTTDFECIGFIKPDQVFDLPVNALLTENEELYFKVDEYDTCSDPFVWSEIHNKDVTKLLKCIPSEFHTNPFFIKLVGMSERVYFQDTNSYKQNCKSIHIHIHPTYIFVNELPVKLKCMVDGYTDAKELLPGKFTNISLPIDENSILCLSFDYSKRYWEWKCKIKQLNDNYIICSFVNRKKQVWKTFNIGIHTESSSGGSVIRTIYCPIWMVNKTEKDLEYKALHVFSQIIKQPKFHRGPMMFSYEKKQFFSKKQVYLKIENSNWSSPIYLENDGSNLVVCRENHFKFNIAVHITRTRSALTKVVTFTPFFVLRNYCDFDLDVRENSTQSEWSALTSKSCCHFWPLKSDENAERAVIVRIAGSEHTSTPLLYSETHSTIVNLKKSEQNIVVQFDVEVTDSGVFPSFSNYSILIAPALVINHTHSSIEFVEYNVFSQQEKLTCLPSRHKIFITFVKPRDKDIKILWNNLKYWADISSDGFGTFYDMCGNTNYWVSFVNRGQRILLFTSSKKVAQQCQILRNRNVGNQEVYVSLHSVGLSIVNNKTNEELLYATIMSPGAMWEAKKQKSKTYQPLKIVENNLIEEFYKKYQKNQTIGKSTPPVQIDELNMEIDFEKSMILKPNTRLLRRIFIPGLLFTMLTTDLETQTNIKIHEIKIDSQIYDSIYPVVFGPVPIPKSLRVKNEKPFAEISICEKLNISSTTREFKYFKIFIQEAFLKLDLVFMNALYYFTQDNINVENGEEELLFNIFLNSLYASLQTYFDSLATEDQKHFYNFIQFSSVKIHITFSLSDNDTSSTDISKYFNFFLYSIGVTLTSVNDVIFNLASFERKYWFLSQSSVLKELKLHYTNQLIKQMYVYVLGLDVFGNPVTFLKGFANGIVNSFYEPYLGATLGISEFTVGLKYGLKSLLNGTIGGFAGVLERITGAIDKGMAPIMFSKSHKKKRNLLLTGKQGFFMAGQVLSMDILHVVLDNFKKPIEGYKKHRIRGCFIGTSLGIFGFFKLPIVGILDCTHFSTRYIKRTFDNLPANKRTRLIRFLQDNSELFPYCPHEAEGYNMLKYMRKKLLFKDTEKYVYHIRLNDGPHFDTLFITNKHIAYVATDVFGSYKFKWIHKWDELRGYPVSVPNGLVIRIKSKHSVNKRTMKRTHLGKLVRLPDFAVSQWLATEIRTLMKIKADRFTRTSYNWKI